ncbi:DUF1129 family protein [Planococcus wigleyi]|uniref:DUF1129 family protein n=1 Tax=Planococcus wigleyi TaxID=2762216 RepID=A0ABR8WAK7_9BACL|nr:DUF1129 family protein [Planococcus wigleyi]MBD8013796.1 DUF1129 family protein [Planococcus wigleyi]
MRKTDELIEENNHKRELLNVENEKVYEDLLLYLRTDLRIDEHAGEEILMDLLDHLVEAQEDGKSAKELFGESPQKYADELIENLPSQKRRNVFLFSASQVLGLTGWFAASFGMISLIVSFFRPVDNSIALGSLLLMLLSVMLVAFVGVSVIFKIIRSSVFQAEKKKWQAYVKAGLYGAAAFACVVLIAWLFQDFGPVIKLEWWLFLLIGLVFLAFSKLMYKWSE